MKFKSFPLFSLNLLNLNILTHFQISVLTRALHVQQKTSIYFNNLYWTLEQILHGLRE